MDSKGHTKIHIYFLSNNFNILRHRLELRPAKAIAREETLTSGKPGKRKKFPFFFDEDLDIFNFWY